MRNLKVNKKFISLFITGSIILSGCSNNDVDNEKIVDLTQTTTQYEVITTSENIMIPEITDSITVIEQTTPYEDIVTTKPSIDKTDIEQAVIEEFETLKNQITNIINSDNAMEFKEDCKNVFITIVDFIFYDGTIKGITFDDLSDTAKEVILKDSSTIDELIMKKFPDYKENISNSTSKAYNKAVELIKKGSDNIKEFSKEKLGEDNYNEIKAFKDKLKDASNDVWEDMKEDAGSIYESAKEKVKNWYENFRQ